MKINRKFVAIAAVVVLALSVLFSIDFKSADNYYADSNEVTSGQLNSDDSKTSLNGTLQNSSSSVKDTSGDSLQSNDNKEDKKGVTKSTNKKEETTDETSSKKSSGSDTKTVNITIDFKTLMDPEHMNLLKPELRKYIPSNGVLLSSTPIEVPADATPFDVLQKATRLNRIQMEYQGADLNAYNSVYIQGINYIYEFSAGGESGWMYSINGNFANYGMNSKKVSIKDGDTIRMAYTVNLGCDVGHSMKQC